MKRSKTKRRVVGVLKVFLTIIFAMFAIISLFTIREEKSTIITLIIGLVGLFFVWFPSIRDSRRKPSDYDFSDFNRSLASKDEEDSNYFL